MPTENQVPASTTAAAPAEPSMAEYGKMREAEMRGQKTEPEVPAAAIETLPDAAATEETEESTAAATNTEDEVEGTTTTESATEEGTEEVEIEEAHPAKKGIQKRFGELTADKKAALAKAEAAEAELAQAKAEVEAARAETERLRTEAAEAASATAAIPIVPKAEEDPAPVREAFDDPDDFVAAVSAHAARVEIRKATAAAHEAAAKREADAQAARGAEQQAKVQAQIVELHKNFNERVTAVKPEYPDYDDKVTNNTELVLRNDVFFTIESSTEAPHLLYHLASNPKEAESLNKLSPIDVALRLGEISAELKQARKPKPTKAAAPIKPVGNRVNPQKKSPHEESMAEYAARREREDQEAASARHPKRANGNR